MKIIKITVHISVIKECHFFKPELYYAYTMHCAKLILFLCSTSDNYFLHSPQSIRKYDSWHTIYERLKDLSIHNFPLLP